MNMFLKVTPQYSASQFGETVTIRTHFNAVPRYKRIPLKEWDERGFGSMTDEAFNTSCMLLGVGLKDAVRWRDVPGRIYANLLFAGTVARVASYWLFCKMFSDH